MCISQISSLINLIGTAITAPQSVPVLVLNEGGRPAEYSFEVPDLVTNSSFNTGYGFIFRIDNPMENSTTYIPMVWQFNGLFKLSGN